MRRLGPASSLALLPASPLGKAPGGRQDRGKGDWLAVEAVRLAAGKAPGGRQEWDRGGDNRQSAAAMGVIARYRCGDEILDRRLLNRD